MFEAIQKNCIFLFKLSYMKLNVKNKKITKSLLAKYLSRGSSNFLFATMCGVIGELFP